MCEKLAKNLAAQMIQLHGFKQKKIKNPLSVKGIEENISTVLRVLAGGYNMDGHPYDQMQEAADYIDELCKTITEFYRDRAIIAGLLQPNWSNDMEWIDEIIIAIEQLKDQARRRDAMEDAKKMVDTSPMYAIGQIGQFEKGSFWDGPTPVLEDMLGSPGKDIDSVIVQLNVDGNATPLFRWDINSEWKKIRFESKEG